MKKKQFIKLPINYSESVNKSAELVRLLGKAKIDNKSLSEFLTIDGINYWELFSPKLSIHHVNNILGSDKLKIKYIVDHETSQVGVYDNILKLSSSYYYSNVINNSRSNIEVKHLDDYVGKKDKIIITSDEFRMKYKKYLLKRGYKEDVDFCWYKKISGIWPYVYEKKVHLFQL